MERHLTIKKRKGIDGMKSLSKYYTSLLLVVVMCVTMLPTVAFATNSSGYGVVNNQSVISGTNGLKNFSNTKNDPACAVSFNKNQTSMKVQFNFPTGVKGKRVEIMLPDALEWVDNGAGGAATAGYISSVSGLTDRTVVTKGLDYTRTLNNGKYTYTVNDNTTQFTIESIIKMTAGFEGQTWDEPIEVKVYWGDNDGNNVQLQDTVYSGKITTELPSNVFYIAQAHLIPLRYYAQLDSGLTLSAWNDLSVAHRDTESWDLFDTECRFKIKATGFVDKSGNAIPGTGDLSKIQFINNDTKKWTFSAPAADGSVQLKLNDYDNGLHVVPMDIVVPSSAGIPAGSIIKIEFLDGEVVGYKNQHHTSIGGDQFVYVQVLSDKEDVFTNLHFLNYGTQDDTGIARPEDGGGNGPLTSDVYLGNRPKTTGELGTYIIGNRGGKDSAQKSIELNFDTNDISVKAISVGVPYKAVSTTDRTNQVKVIGNTVYAYAVDEVTGAPLNGGHPYTWTIPSDIINNQNGELVLLAGIAEFGMPANAAISKMVYELNKIPAGDIIPGAGGATGGATMKFYGNVKNINKTAKSTIEIYNSADPTVTTKPSSIFTKTHEAIGMMKVLPKQSVVVNAGGTADMEVYVGHKGSMSAPKNGVTTNPIVYLRNDLYSNGGQIDKDSFEVLDIYGNPLVKGTDYTVTEFTDQTGAQVVKIDTAGVLDERSSLMGYWTPDDGLMDGDIGSYTGLGTNVNVNQWGSYITVRYKYKASPLASNSTQPYSTYYYAEDPDTVIGVLPVSKTDEFNLSGKGTAYNHMAGADASMSITIKAAQDMIVKTAGKHSDETDYRDPYDGTNPIRVTPKQTLDFKVSFINATGNGGAVLKSRVYCPIPKVADSGKWGVLTTGDTKFDVVVRQPMTNPDPTKYEILYGTVTPTDDGTTLDGYYASNKFEAFDPNHAADYNCITIRLKDNQKIDFVGVPGGTEEQIIAANTTDFVVKLGLNTLNMPDEDDAGVDVVSPYYFRSCEIQSTTGSTKYEKDSVGDPIGISTNNVLVNLDAIKHLTGSKTDTDITANQFSFRLELTQGDVADVEGIPTKVVGCKAGTAGGASVDFGNVRIFEPGTYKFRISEVQGNEFGYKYDNSPVTVEVKVVQDSNGKLTVDSKTIRKNNKTVTDIEFENTYNDYSIKITKNDKDGTLLKNAGFKLYSDANCTTIATVFTDLGKTTALTANTDAVTDANGVLHFYGLVPGTYYLKEVKTPSGYQLLENAVPIVVATDGAVTVSGTSVTPVNNEIAVTVTNKDLTIDVPATGLGGVLPYLLISIIAMLATFVGFLVYRRKRRLA